MKLLLLMLFIMTFACAVAAQSQETSATAVTSDESRAFMLNHSAPEDAISVLGQPDSDKLDNLEVQKIENWLTAKRKEKVFRVLTFKKAQGYEQIELSYMEGKLVMIHYVLEKRLPIAILPRAYGIGFSPVISKLEKDVRPENYYQKHGNVQAAKYPSTYYMLGVSAESFIVARVFNSETNTIPTQSVPGQGITRRVAGVPPQINGGMAAPGKVAEISIISRQVQN